MIYYPQRYNITFGNHVQITILCSTPASLTFCIVTSLTFNHYFSVLQKKYVRRKHLHLNAVRYEVGGRWATIMAVFQCLVAWAVAFLAYNIATILL